MEAGVRRPFRISCVRSIEVGDHRKNGIASGHERKEDAGDEDVIGAHDVSSNATKGWYQGLGAGGSQKVAVDNGMPPVAARVKLSHLSSRKRY